MIAGLGSIGRRHLRNLQTILRTDQALESNDILLYRTHRATLPDDELAGLPVETDLEAALAQRPEAVIVSNPTALHLDVAIPAARAGCALFLEKPISHSTERLDELANAVQAGGRPALVGFQFRFHPGLHQVHTWLQAEAIGRPLSVRAHWGEYLPGWHPWEDYRQGYSARPDLGGGVVLTLSHPLDYLRWLLGEVDALWAFTSSQSSLKLPVEDSAEIGLRFASGVLGSVHLDYVQRPPSHHLEITGDRGVIRWDNADGAAHLLLPGQAPQTVHPPAGFERNHLFLAQMHHFLDIVRGHSAPLCTLTDGVRALELALATHISQAEGRLVHFS